jgi:hypothetical protein
LRVAHNIASWILRGSILVILNFKNLQWNKKHHLNARESLKFEKGINYIKDGEVKSFQFNYEANECR